MWDLTLPGYRYLGPGNKLNKGKPTNPSDLAARYHDIEYDKYIKQGKNPYTHWNSADEEFIKKASAGDYGGFLGKAFFNIKKGANKIGLLDSIKDVPNLRGSKRPNMEPQDTSMKRLRVNRWNKYVDGQAPEKPTQGTVADSTSNAQVNMGDKATEGGSGNASTAKETPVDDPYMVYRGPPDYTFASLPYSETRQNLVATTFAVDHIYRMTSPYDCRIETTQTDQNTAAGILYVHIENESSTLKARWFDYYAGMYNYYHVIGCQWNVFIENMSGEPMWVYQMFYNDEQPNPLATNEDMQLWNGVKYKYLDRRYLGVESTGRVITSEMTDNERADEATTYTGGTNTYNSSNHVSNNAVSKTVFSGEYHTGDYRREIRLDSSVENWTATNTNPVLPEKLLIRVKPFSEKVVTNDASSAGDTLKYRIQVKLNYLVEFKELNTSLRYPVVRQPITVTLSSDATTTT